MSALFRRHSSNIQCFFCQTLNTQVLNTRNFKCPTCGCWNRYDDKGEILSDEPAMHDEHLNKSSFYKRASPSKERLPTMYGPGPFCHTCQTNQMLLINLLSNYLPSPESPEYTTRLESLEEYRESLHLRYPPVCNECLPVVEEEIRKKDHMARTKALGAWLSQSKGKEQQRRVSGAHKEREKIVLELNMWRVRGCLWTMSSAASLFCYSTAALGYAKPQSLVVQITPFIVFISLLWTAWDPTYASFRRLQLQGRDVRVQGKKQYITFQLTSWAIRLVTSVLAAINWTTPHILPSLLRNPAAQRVRLYFTTILIVELTILASSFVVLRLKHPPTIRLIDVNSHKPSTALSRSVTPHPASRANTPADPDILAALTLSSKPILTPNKPVFGLPSLLSTSTQPKDDPENDDEMDWTPTNPDAGSPFIKKRQRSKVEDDSTTWLRPQRFFAPEKPTGLEGLFERTKLDDETIITPVDNAVRRLGIRFQIASFGHHWWRIFVFLLLSGICSGFGYRILRMRKAHGMNSDAYLATENIEL